MSTQKKHIKRLIKRISAYDDQAAFETLFNLYFSWLRSVSMSIVGVSEDSEEIIEDVFVKLWSMRRELPNVKNIETYLYVATKNSAYNYKKKFHKGCFVELQYESQQQSCSISPEESFIVEELKKQIEVAIAHLPKKCREVFNAVRQEGQSHKKAAGILNISPKTVENQLAIAIKKIKVELDGYLNESSGQTKKEFMLIALISSAFF